VLWLVTLWTARGRLRPRERINTSISTGRRWYSAAQAHQRPFLNLARVSTGLSGVVSGVVSGVFQHISVGIGVDRHHAIRLNDWRRPCQCGCGFVNDCVDGYRYRLLTRTAARTFRVRPFGLITKTVHQTAAMSCQ
jgi:hypothetical protein